MQPLTRLFSEELNSPNRDNINEYLLRTIADALHEVIEEVMLVCRYTVE